LCRHIAIIDHGVIAENTDMKSLLEQLQVETFILDLARPVTQAPQLDGFEVSLRDAKTLEVAVPKSESLNTLFAELARQNFEVMSMRNKANRLEELFVRLVEQNLPGGRAS
jgi:ABC-2 type transport system ATP-binding protein